MKLESPNDHHINELMTWFPDEAQLNKWSGPGFRYPFDSCSFKQDLKVDSLASFSLLSTCNEFLAFGQYYLRLDKCHLGRLVVNPAFRGQGVAQHLVHLLRNRGQAELGTTQCSLFVLADNVNAIKAYSKLGFSIAEYPDEIGLDNCLYMVTT